LTPATEKAMAWLAQWLPQQLRSPDTLARWQDHQLALALPVRLRLLGLLVKGLK
jgi:hypothetical protein